MTTFLLCLILATQLLIWWLSPSNERVERLLGSIERELREIKSWQRGWAHEMDRLTRNAINVERDVRRIIDKMNRPRMKHDPPRPL